MNRTQYLAEAVSSVVRFQTTESKGSLARFHLAPSERDIHNNAQDVLGLLHEAAAIHALTGSDEQSGLLSHSLRNDEKAEKERSLFPDFSSTFTVVLVIPARRAEPTQ